MKLTKRQAGHIRETAFFSNLSSEKAKESKIETIRTAFPDNKVEEAIAYFKYLTESNGQKTYVVDFLINSGGAGHLTFHDCTAEEAVEKAIYQLQNGAFGKYEKLEDIKIDCVRPEAIHYNTYEDFLNRKAKMAKELSA